MICLLLSDYYWYILIIIPLDWLYQCYTKHVAEPMFHPKVMIGWLRNFTTL